MGFVVSVDTVGAGFHERVLIVGGSSARLAEGNKDCPVDSAIVGVIDSFEFDRINNMQLDIPKVEKDLNLSVVNQKIEWQLVPIMPLEVAVKKFGKVRKERFR